jgi:hypothetical protein
MRPERISALLVSHQAISTRNRRFGLEDHHAPSAGAGFVSSSIEEGSV